MNNDYIGRWEVTEHRTHSPDTHTLYGTYETPEEARADVEEMNNIALGGINEIRWSVDEDGTHTGAFGFSSDVLKRAGMNPFTTHKTYVVSQIQPLAGPEVVSAQVGYIDVDAGIVQIGDPCYTLRSSRAKELKTAIDSATYKALIEIARRSDSDAVDRLLADAERSALSDFDDVGVNYDEMIDHLFEKADNEFSVAPSGYTGAWAPYRRDMQGAPHGPGAGIVVSSGFGDGSYPVTVEFYASDHPDPSMRSRVKSLRVDFIGSEDDDVE